MVETPRSIPDTNVIVYGIDKIGNKGLDYAPDTTTNEKYRRSKDIDI